MIGRSLGYAQNAVKLDGLVGRDQGIGLEPTSEGGFRVLKDGPDADNELLAAVVAFPQGVTGRAGLCFPRHKKVRGTDVSVVRAERIAVRSIAFVHVLE